MSFCNAPMMNEIEADVQYPEGLVGDDDTVTVGSTRELGTGSMASFDDVVRRVPTALLKADGSTAAS